MVLQFLNVLFSFFFLFFSTSSAELISSLPDQPGNVLFNQHSGYIVTDTKHGRALFYYFVQADSVEPLTRPLTLWLNGGPGCSSLGFGAFMEHGPFQPGEDGRLNKNKYSWNLESNMLYVESPIGVGFSYSNTSSDYNSWNDARTAEDNLRFIINWLEEFPQYKDKDLYLTGESYAGHYIPQLAALILEYNKKSSSAPIKLKAIALGNPLLDLDISISAANYLWSHGAISDETLELERTVCNDTTNMKEYIHGKWSQGCNNVFNRVADEIGVTIDRSDLLLPACRQTVLSSLKSEENIFYKLMTDTESVDHDERHLELPETQKTEVVTEREIIKNSDPVSVGDHKYGKNIREDEIVEDVKHKAISLEDNATKNTFVADNSDATEAEQVKSEISNEAEQEKFEIPVETFVEVR